MSGASPLPRQHIATLLRLCAAGLFLLGAYSIHADRRVPPVYGPFAPSNLQRLGIRDLTGGSVAFAEPAAGSTGDATPVTILIRADWPSLSFEFDWPADVPLPSISLENTHPSESGPDSPVELSRSDLPVTVIIPPPSLEGPPRFLVASGETARSWIDYVTVGGHDAHVDFVAVLGDAFGEEDFAEAPAPVRPLARLGGLAPIFAVPGAREIEAGRVKGSPRWTALSARRRFEALIGPPIRAFDLRGERFLFLDTVRRAGGVARSIREMDELLAAMPAAEGTVRLFAYNSPVEEAGHPGKGLSGDARADLVSAMQRWRVTHAYFGDGRRIGTHKLGEVECHVLPAGRSDRLIDVVGQSVNVASTLLYDARVLSVEAPRRVVAGTWFHCRVRLLNTGLKDWAESDLVLFGETTSPPPLTIERAPLPAPSISPHEPVTLTIALRAPDTPGVVRTKWRMLVENEAFFGQTADIEVNVVEAKR